MLLFSSPFSVIDFSRASYLQSIAPAKHIVGHHQVSPAGHFTESLHRQVVLLRIVERISILRRDDCLIPSRIACETRGFHKSHSIKYMTIPFLPASCIRGCGTYYDSSGRTRIDEMYFKVRGSNLDDVRLDREVCYY